MNYRKLTGIILKKQNYREADQIATVYTKEYGKIRCVARSLRSSKSKLMGSFQDFAMVEMETTNGKSLPVLVSAKNLESFNSIRTDLSKMALAFYGIELVMKLSADEQPNAPAFDLLLEFLRAINSCESDPANAEVNEMKLYLILDNFGLRFMDSIGFSVEYAKQDFAINADKFNLIQKIEQGDSESVVRIETDLRSVKQVHKIIGQFIEYILERSIKSESFLKNI